MLFAAVLGQGAKAEALILETVDGTVYEEVHVKRSLPTSITFKHAQGIATVPSGALNDESLSKLGLNPADNPQFQSQRDDMAMKMNLITLKKNRQSIPLGVGTGETILTKDITDINPVTILVTQDGVPKRVELIVLPKEIQEELGYDAAKAAAYTSAKAAAEQKASTDAALLMAQQQKEAQEAAKKRAEAEAKAAAAAKKAKAPTEDPNRFNAIKPVK